MFESPVEVTPLPGGVSCAAISALPGSALRLNRVGFCGHSIRERNVTHVPVHIYPVDDSGGSPTLNRTIGLSIYWTDGLSGRPDYRICGFPMLQVSRTQPSLRF